MWWIPAGTNLRITASTPWRPPTKYSSCWMIAIENRLRGELVALVEIQKCLVCGIVGKKRGGECHGPWRGADGIARAEANGLAIDQYVGGGPSGAMEHAAIDGEFEAVANQRHQGVALRSEKRNIEQAIGGIDAEFVPCIEDVNHNGEIDFSIGDANVDVAERHRMRGGRLGNCEKQNECDEGCGEPDNAGAFYRAAGGNCGSCHFSFPVPPTIYKSVPFDKAFRSAVANETGTNSSLGNLSYCDD